MPAAAGKEPLAGAEQRFLLERVPWWTYVALRDALDDTGIRMTYLEGSLELMSPSERHEEEKTIIARLLETWAVERAIDLRGFGNTTFRREAERRGLEPDECYVIGPKQEGTAPQIAIEVVDRARSSTSSRSTPASAWPRCGSGTAPPARSPCTSCPAATTASRPAAPSSPRWISRSSPGSSAPARARPT